MWHFYDNLGAVHYGVQFKRNAASKVVYFADSWLPSMDWYIPSVIDGDRTVMALRLAGSQTIRSR